MHEQQVAVNTLKVKPVLTAREATAGRMVGFTVGLFVVVITLVGGAYLVVQWQGVAGTNV